MTEPMFESSRYDSATRFEVTQGGWLILHGLFVEPLNYEDLHPEVSNDLV